MTRVIAAAEPGAVEAVCEVLERGGLAVIPTDTVYGLAAHPLRREAVERIFVIKGRSNDLPIPVLVASMEDAERLAVFVAEARREAEDNWPGPLTVVLRRAEAARPLHLGGDGETIGLRVPDHPFTLAVLRAAGPLAVTSANLTGQNTPASVEEVRQALGEAAALYVDGGLLTGAPSRVVSYVDEPQELRSRPS
jgi:tRNA threonylcarbamoyl adenosine modification protein (Sua5/YciO/YrdC/YwlC family)